MIIYLVDDDEIFNYLHTSVAHHINKDIEVKTFKSGDDLLSYLNNNRASIIYPDIMFIDIRMPNIDGFELMDIISNDETRPFADTKIYMLSSTLDQRDLEKTRQYKMVKDFISKPLTIEKLQGILGEFDNLTI